MKQLSIAIIKRDKPRPGAHKSKLSFLVRKKENPQGMPKPLVSHTNGETLVKTCSMEIHLEKWLFRMRR